jgi:hypothetical protein
MTDNAQSLVERLPNLKERALQFTLLQLPGQPQGMHMGTSYLVSDLLKFATEAADLIDRLTAALTAETARAEQLAKNCLAMADSRALMEARAERAEAALREVQALLSDGMHFTANSIIDAALTPSPKETT